MKQFFYILGSFIYIIFFSNCNESSNLPDPLEAGWKGEVICEVISDNSELRVLKCKLPPNVGHERHYHNAHVGYTLAGGKIGRAHV